MFPDFDLDHPQIQRLIRRDEDRHYYARVRLSPTWVNDEGDPLSVMPIGAEKDSKKVLRSDRDDQREAQNGVERGDTKPILHRVLTDQEMHVWKRGDNRSSGNETSLGEALFYEMYTKPSGFYIEDRGLTFFNPKEPERQDRYVVDWEVGVDFGTSNTFVAYKTNEGKPQSFEFQMFTSTLLKSPLYSVHLGNVNEAAAAVIDFFYKYEETGKVVLNQDRFFPTQILTAEEQIYNLNEENLNLKNGLIWFSNISFADAGEIIPLIRGFNPELAGGVDLNTQRFEQRYRIKQNIKWEQTEWLHAFMQHLRKQIILTAAYQNAKIQKILFSYPKAFLPQQRDNFKNRLKNTWFFDHPKVKLPWKLISESEAVREGVAQRNYQYIVFDIGGGTTDLIIFNLHKPVCQSSFKFAASQINKYVIESQAFRTCFFGAFLEVVGDKYSYVLKEENINIRAQSDDEILMVENYWIGMLQTIEKNEEGDESDGTLHQILDSLLFKVEPEDIDTLRGFFLTLTLLFTGLAFYAGMLLRSASAGKLGVSSFPLRRIDIKMLGNGSKFYSMLNRKGSNFDAIMQQMFDAGLTAIEDEATGLPLEEINFTGFFTQNGRQFPKAAVSYGLLTGTDADHQPVPVANIVGEKEYLTSNKSELSQNSLIDLMNHVNEGKPINIPEEPPYYLNLFMQKLSELLPGGYSNGVQIIPGVDSAWSSDIEERLYRKARVGIQEIIIDNARKYKDNTRGNAGDGNGAAMETTSLEPIFISQLAALLEAIRETHAE